MPSLYRTYALIESYTTLAAETRCEIEKVKGSRFLGVAAPVGDELAAAAFVERVRARFPDARHHCWAFRLGPAGGRFRSSDGGEPGGSAGRPILARLEAADVTDTAVVVARWFGGTKLGVGGLARAYGAAARAVLAAAEPRRVEVTERLELEFAYDRAGAVDALLAATNLAPAEEDYAERVRLAVDVPVASAERFERRFRDATAGRGRCRRSGGEGS